MPILISYKYLVILALGNSESSYGISRVMTEQKLIELNILLTELTSSPYISVVQKDFRPGISVSGAFY